MVEKIIISVEPDALQEKRKEWKSILEDEPKKSFDFIWGVEFPNPKIVLPCVKHLTGVIGLKNLVDTAKGELFIRSLIPGVALKKRFKSSAKKRWKEKVLGGDIDTFPYLKNVDWIPSDLGALRGLKGFMTLMISKFLSGASKSAALIELRKDLCWHYFPPNIPNDEVQHHVHLGSGNMDPAGLGPLANIQCWHLKSRVGPGGVVPSKRLGHDLVGVEQSPEKLVLLELCVLDLSSHPVLHLLIIVHHIQWLVLLKEEGGSAREKTAPLKRSKVMEMGMFQDENGFKVLNPGMPRSKICSTSQARVTRSADITGNIGYTPTSTSKLKWNGNTAISTKKLQEIKEKKRKKNVESSSNNSSKKTLIQSSRCPGNCSHVDYFKHCFKLDQLT
ncbi:putative F-box protein-like [Capsicum annuum]|nr:putative F-box protein-like [Capsicum annuum]